MIYREEFPNLNDDDFEITSDPDKNYNCIAWAAGANDRVWDPDEDYYWPIDERDDTVAALVAAFEYLGFEQCDDGAYEAGIQKIAIYGADGLYTHAARQLRNGQWTSKLGLHDDIKHLLAHCLCGGTYGRLIAFMRRSYPDDKVLGDNG